MINKIMVYDLFGSFAIADEDGEILHQKIENLLPNSEKVIVDFTNVETVLTQFLNASIATLYQNHSGEELRNKLVVKGLKSTASLKKVISRAKMFYQDEKKTAAMILKEEFYE